MLCTLLNRVSSPSPEHRFRAPRRAPFSAGIPRDNGRQADRGYARIPNECPVNRRRDAADELRTAAAGKSGAAARAVLADRQSVSRVRTKLHPAAPSGDCASASAAAAAHCGSGDHCAPPSVAPYSVHTRPSYSPANFTVRNTAHRMTVHRDVLAYCEKLSADSAWAAN